ncbi:serpin family protein [Geomesophilobacter sediminis]|uniref:Serpin family protein n=1 Tax=Geomesophilobacter sediminis TaxID=2798584 RepID=A0A8J7J7N2_9BACT|nr:serpin family protein [Geomesophilobacter sediminis]MBJ6725336.1 serpin family protein [Geomesophilobacter sediminis]
MQTSSLRNLVVALICAFSLFTGCNGSSSSPTSSVVRSALSRNTSPSVPDADLAAVVSGNNQFALNIFPLIGNDNTNSSFSPYSITQAFALLTAGAQGNTLTQIELALCFTLPQERLNPAFNKLDLLITQANDGSNNRPIIHNANALWLQQDFSILPTYLDTLAVNYGAGVHTVDFVTAWEPARLAINAWVAEQTNNKILNLMPSGSVTTDTKLVLTNAVWLKAAWAAPFEPSATSAESFFNRDGSSASVPFMHQISAFPYAETAGCRAVELPYVGNDLAMLVVLPNPGSFDAFLGTFSPAVLGQITTALTLQGIELNLPKFRADGDFGLKETLSALGISDAFSPNADFSLIDGRHDLSVASVEHKAFTVIDENGTEAAAATGIGAGGGYVSTSIPLAIDHPFLYLIRDRTTGLILFMGKVVNF